LYYELNKIRTKVHFVSIKIKIRTNAKEVIFLFFIFVFVFISNSKPFLAETWAFF
jgi:hypothetical protein